MIDNKKKDLNIFNDYEKYKILIRNLRRESHEKINNKKNNNNLSKERRS